MQHTITVDGLADPATAWGRYRSTAEWPIWAPQIRMVDPPAENLRPGLRGVVRGPAWLRVSFVVDEVDDDERRWSWTARLGLLTAHMRHSVVAIPGGSRTELTLIGPWPVCVAYPIVARVALKRLVAPTLAGPA